MQPALLRRAFNTAWSRLPSPSPSAAASRPVSSATITSSNNRDHTGGKNGGNGDGKDGTEQQPPPPQQQQPQSPSPPPSRQLFRDRIGDSSQKYQVSYDAIRSSAGGAKPMPRGENPFVKTSLPETVSRNVKNVQGWRGAALRGFRSNYPDVVHVLTADVASGTWRFDNDAMGHWFRKVRFALNSIKILLKGFISIWGVGTFFKL